MARKRRFYMYHANLFLLAAGQALRVVAEHACAIQNQEGACGPCLLPVLLIAQCEALASEHGRVAELARLAAAVFLMHADDQMAGDLRGLGMSTQIRADFVGLLRSKGGPSDAAAAHVEQSVRACGLAEIEACLKSPSDATRWKLLCALNSANDVRLVTAEELKAARKKSQSKGRLKESKIPWSPMIPGARQKRKLRSSWTLLTGNLPGSSDLRTPTFATFRGLPLPRCRADVGGVTSSFEQVAR